jgi:hypothetical protein
MADADRREGTERNPNPGPRAEASRRVAWAPPVRARLAACLTRVREDREGEMKE